MIEDEIPQQTKIVEVLGAVFHSFSFAGSGTP